MLQKEAHEHPPCHSPSTGVPYPRSMCTVYVSDESRRDLPFTLPIIEFNGAFLSEYRTGRHEIVNAIPAPIAMANAKPAVKSVAREIIGSNNDGSVVRRIRQDRARRTGR